MRTIRIFAHVSIDGVISPGAPDDDGEYARGGWMAPFRTPAGGALLVEAHGSNFDLLLGRRTYDLWSGFWPKAPSSPIADGLNAATKYVATHRPGGLAWGPVGDLGPDALAGVRDLKSGDGPDLIVWGSTTLTPDLFDLGLVDGVLLIVYPILFGRGRRCFSDRVDPHALALVDSKATPAGVLFNTYKYVGPVPPPSTPD